MTFGAVVLIGTIISFALLGSRGETPFQQGERVGRGVGILGAICAAVAYVAQQRRLTRK